MALREIRKEGDEILRKKSRKVEFIDDRIKELIKDMDETMHAANGVGLSAVQVGVLKRIIVIDINYDGSPSIILINPEIVKAKGKEEYHNNCLFSVKCEFKFICFLILNIQLFFYQSPLSWFILKLFYEIFVNK